MIPGHKGSMGDTIRKLQESKGQTPLNALQELAMRDVAVADAIEKAKQYYKPAESGETVEEAHETEITPEEFLNTVASFFDRGNKAGFTDKDVLRHVVMEAQKRAQQRAGKETDITSGAVSKPIMTAASAASATESVAATVKPSVEPDASSHKLGG